MNNLELQALSAAISNDARVLYCLGLRPGVEPLTGATAPINYKTLIALLNGKQSAYQRGRQINELLKELASAGLVAAADITDLDSSLNGKCLQLPLSVQQNDDFESLHQNWQGMHKGWQPQSTLFDDLAHLVGLIDKAYSQDELGEFIAYWMGRPQHHLSPFQWTQKFVLFIKQKRLAHGITSLQKVGTQLVKPEAAVEVDENARKLMEKYSKK